MRNYFWADTGFQVLCAQEARQALAANEQNYLVLEARGGDGARALNLTQMQTVLDGGWDEVIVHIYPNNKGPKRSLVRFWQALKTRVRFGAADRLFVGLYSDSWCKRFTRILGCKQMVRFDDGTATIVLLDKMRADQCDVGPDITAFSCFVREEDGPGFVKNTFTGLKRKRRPNQRISSDLTWVLGGAYSENGLMPFSEELQLLQALYAQVCSAEDVYYLPHRADGADKLRALQDLGYKLPNIGPSFEERLLQSEVIPAQIFGVASTALFSARSLYPELKYATFYSATLANKGYERVYREAAHFGIAACSLDEA